MNFSFISFSFFEKSIIIPLRYIAKHCFFDFLISGFLIVFGLWIALRPPDISHPQGHGRFEPLAGLVVTLSMGFASYEAARASVERYISGGTIVDPGLPAYVLLGSALLKGIMFYVIRRLARELSSPTLSAASKDNLSDVLTSVAAFVGILGTNFLSPLSDPIAGFLVAIWIFKSALEAGKENLNYLTGAGAPETLRKQIVDISASIPGVVRVHQTMTEYVGPLLVVDMHINVAGNISLKAAHGISEKVIAALEALPEVDRAYVHVEPDE